MPTSYNKAYKYARRNKYNNLNIQRFILKMIKQLLVFQVSMIAIKFSQISSFVVIITEFEVNALVYSHV